MWQSRGAIKSQLYLSLDTIEYQKSWIKWGKKITGDLKLLRFLENSALGSITLPPFQVFHIAEFLASEQGQSLIS